MYINLKHVNSFKRRIEEWYTDIINELKFHTKVGRLAIDR